MKNPLAPMKAKIAGVRDDTHDVRSYTLETPEGAFGDFRPGQFNMVGLPGVGEAPISLSTLVADGAFEHTIRAVGRVTRYLARLEEGDGVHLRGPYGRGWPVENARGGDLLLVGGGLGLAPLRPVIQAVMADRDSFGGVSLAYGARDPMNVIYPGEFDRWRESVQVLLTVDEAPEGSEWPHRTGLVTELLGDASLDIANASAFVCGPEIMMRFVCRRLLQLGLSPARLHVSLERRMKCGVGQCGHCQHGSAFVCRDGPVFLYREAGKFPDGLL
jgi:NAD(P)H-flavin reductase